MIVRNPLEQQPSDVVAPREESPAEMCLTHDTLVKIFSFLNGRDIRKISTVNKLWSKASPSPSLALNFIKNSYLQQFLDSKLSVKEFYLQNIDARRDTFYIVGEVIKTGRTLPQAGFIKVARVNVGPLTTEDVLEALNFKDTQFTLYGDFEEAKIAAEAIAQPLIPHGADDTTPYFKYPPIFVIKVTDLSEIRAFDTLTTPSSNIERIYSAVYRRDRSAEGIKLDVSEKESSQCLPQTVPAQTPRTGCVIS